LKAESLFHIKSNKAQSLLPFIGQTFILQKKIYILLNIVITFQLQISPKEKSSCFYLIRLSSQSI